MDLPLITFALEHCPRDVAHLHREEAAEPATFGGAGQLHYVCAFDVGQQFARRGVNAQPAQEMAGGMIRDLARRVSAHVAHAQNVNQEL
jgi:hypothetical protein